MSAPDDERAGAPEAGNGRAELIFAGLVLIAAAIIAVAAAAGWLGGGGCGS